MDVSLDSVVFKLLELYRRANKSCQETCQGKLLVCIGLNCEMFPIYLFICYINIDTQHLCVHEICFCFFSKTITNDYV